MTTTRTPRGRTLAAFAFFALPLGALVLGAQASDAPPVILYNTSPRAIEYQIGRLTNNELMRVDRRADVKYRPVYVVMLTRKGLGREYFDEALDALVKIDKATRTRVLLDAMRTVKADDAETAEKMLRVLFAQPIETLRKERAVFAQAAEAQSAPVVLRAAYGGMILADGNAQAVWPLAVKRDGHVAQLLLGLSSFPSTPAAQDARAKLTESIASTLTSTTDASTRVAALSALGWARADAAAFRLLAKEVIDGTDPEARAAAIRALHRIPAAAWPAADAEPLARAIVSAVSKASPSARTEPSMTEAIQLGEKLADILADEPKRSVRRDLRALGVQVVRIETIPEQMTFDLRWFAVEAGKPVQIVLYNPDAMSHNLLLTRPGALKEVGTAASTMTLPTDPKIKPYVPDSPLVLQATRLLNWGETERLGFTAPKDPGEYPFVCTFPGHWVRMYGVMLVVPSLDAWEAKRTVPTDPMTGQPFAAQRQ